MDGLLDTGVLVLSVVFGLASVVLPDVLKRWANAWRSILGAMALALIALTIWQQISAAKVKRKADERHTAEVNDNSQRLSEINAQIAALKENGEALTKLLASCQQNKTEANALNAQISSINTQVSSLQTTVRSLAPDAAIGRGDVLPKASYNAGGMSVLYTVENFGQRAASGIVVYSATQLGDATDYSESRQGIFSALARSIGESRKANHGTSFPGELPPLGNLSLTAGSGTISPSNLQALKARRKSLYVMFYLDYKNSKGEPQVAVFCDSWSGDPAQPTRCPGNWRDYYEIIRDTSVPNR